MGLRPQQHQALLAIKGTPGGHFTIGILAERLGIRHNNAVELIDRLIKNSLVERRHNPTDRREVLIDLTNRAEQILAKLSLAHRNEIKKLAPLLIGSAVLNLKQPTAEACFDRMHCVAARWSTKKPCSDGVPFIVQNGHSHR